MQHTYTGLLTLQTIRHPSPSSQPSAPPSSFTLTNPTTIDSLRTETVGFTRTRRTGSTVWGPGALTGILLKRVGEGVERGAEYMIIRTKLRGIAKMQPALLGSARRLTNDEAIKIKDQCEKLVDLCIDGMGYPTKVMTRAFCLILSGFEQPGRKMWSYYIAEAISERDNINVFEIFRDCFFALLDDSIFQIDGVVDLETLSFRRPAIAHEIAVVISHLARKDCMMGSSPVPTASAFSLSLASDITAENPAFGSSFSSAIIRAGFFRLVRHWTERGLPHWDQRGVERLEIALKDIADAQKYHGDLEKHAEEAQELMRSLQGRRLHPEPSRSDIESSMLPDMLRLDDVEEVSEPEESELEIQENG